MRTADSWIRVRVESLGWLTSSPLFMELECSLPCSKLPGNQPYLEPDETNPRPIFNIHFNSLHLYVGLQRYLFLSLFATKTYTFLNTSRHILIMLAEEYKASRYVIMPVTSSFLGPDVNLNTSSLCSCFTAGD
jgi:hypothetical protein